MCLQWSRHEVYLLIKGKKICQHDNECFIIKSIEAKLPSISAAAAASTSSSPPSSSSSSQVTNTATTVTCPNPNPVTCPNPNPNPNPSSDPNAKNGHTTSANPNVGLLLDSPKNLHQNMRRVRVICTDPDATDSSSDEEAERISRSSRRSVKTSSHNNLVPKRVVRELFIPPLPPHIHSNISNSRSDDLSNLLNPNLLNPNLPAFNTPSSSSSSIFGGSPL